MECKKRKPNWSTEEVEALVQAVTENIKIIRGKFTPSLTNGGEESLLGRYNRTVSRPTYILYSFRMDP